MPALRCSVCGINYPHSAANAICKVCGEKCHLQGYAVPDKDWEERVALAKVKPEDVASDDRLYKWRFDRLVEAGFSLGSAAEMALKREIDLHRACELARTAGPELAYRIVT